MKTWLSKIRLWEIGLCVFLGFGCYLLWTTTQTEKQVASQTSSVLTHADSVLTDVDNTTKSTTAVTTQLTNTLSTLSYSVSSSSDRLNAVLDKIAAPCTPEKGHVYAVGEDKPCGTLADVARTLNTIRGFSGTLTFAGRHLDKSLTTYDQQELQLNAQLNQVLGNVSDTTDFALNMMKTHQLFLDNLQRLSGNTADTMENVKGITADIHVQTKKWNAPKSKTQRVLQWAPASVKVGMTVTCALLGPC